MVRFSTLSDHAVGSIYDYLMTVPALDKQVERTTKSGDYASAGAELFDSKGCSSCHGNNGVGIASLMLADRKYPEDSTLIDVIKDESRYNPDTFMPMYGEILSDEDLQALALRVRKLCNGGGDVAQAR